ncbi:MAG: hypothetical protein D6688_10245 [Alphaproteobacteria bacterium]|nr:MAG: hypothetical protein D6688_10245 [Alphaproteobacteria bacterium]
MTKDGAPKMKALNAALEAMGLDPVDSEARDAALAEQPASAQKMVVMTDPRVNSLLVSVNGKVVELYRGHAVKADDGIIEALQTAGVEIEVRE